MSAQTLHPTWKHEIAPGVAEAYLYNVALRKGNTNIGTNNSNQRSNMLLIRHHWTLGRISSIPQAVVTSDEQRKWSNGRRQLRNHKN